MPELPEVETVKNGLRQNIVGKTIARVDVRDARLRWPVDTPKLQALLPGRAITVVDRKAKYLIVQLEGDFTLIMHLGMSGRILLYSDAPELHKHDHVVFGFSDGSEMRFRDPRRFGMVDICAVDELPQHKLFAKLGVEPLSPDLTGEVLKKRAGAARKPIKNLLMDAHFIVGVGNIYANEALYQASIHPLTAADQLVERDWQHLLEKVQAVLRQAIEMGGTTLNDFVNSSGDPGYFQQELGVYDREGEPCLRCGATIERIVLVGRSTYFCPKCQAL